MNSFSYYKLKIIRVFVVLLGGLPQGASKFFSDALGTIWFYADRRHRKITLNNLEIAYGKVLSQDQIRNLAQRVFRNIASLPFEVAWSFKIDKKTLLNHVTIKGFEHVKKAHKKGKGVIVLTCHLGNFEMLITAIEGTGLEGYAVYRKLDDSHLDPLMLEIRQRFGVTMIPTKGASRKIQAVLEKGGVVGILLDQNVDIWTHGVFADFFGRPACTNFALASLVLKTKAVVLPMYTVRKGRQFLIEFLPEIPLEETGDRINDIEKNTQNYVSAIEFMVRKHPDQYFWVHNRWKTKNYCVLPDKTSDIL